MRRVKHCGCFFFFRFSTVAACSGKSTSLLGNCIGVWSLGTCCLDQVRATGGAVSSSAANVLDRVFADGEFEGRGVPMYAAHRPLCSSLLMLDLVVAMRVAWLCTNKMMRLSDIGPIVCRLLTRTKQQAPSKKIKDGD